MDHGIRKKDENPVPCQIGGEDVRKFLDKEWIGRLSEIVGEKNVLTDEENLERYSRDETMGLQAFPDVVVKAGNVQEISKVVRLAAGWGIPVTPRGLGTGLSGGCLPTLGGIVLSMERMNRVLDVDHENLMVVTEPAVITAELHRTVEAEGLFYPPDPASLESCSIGGNVAEGSGGPRAVRYGTTKDYVCGLEAVLPNGEIISTGGKVVKDVTGYNLTQLLVGSEGTLAIFTRITLRLIPKPKLKVNLLAPFGELSAAAKTVSALLQEKIVPTAVEFMDQPAMRLAEKYLKKEIVFDTAAAHLLIELDGNRKEDFDHLLDTVGTVCERFGAWDLLVADQKEAQNRLWEGRRCIFEAANRIGGVYETMDVVVPRSRIADLVRSAQGIAEKSRLEPVCVGHAGDGNVHVLYFKPEDMEKDRWTEEIKKATLTLYRTTLEMGGKITAEHGIGLTRKPYLSLDLSETQIELLKGIKKAFDPKGILNPGKIF
jgi:glycolate oxidase